MSKELTEQYRNGTLPCGFYYFTNGKDIYPIHHRQVKGLTGVKGVEVVAEVPTYEEYLKLESDSLAKQEGAEIVAELEARLQEAETVIQLYFKNTQNATYQSLGMNDGYYKKAFIHALAKEYLEKYGVEK